MPKQSDAKWVRLFLGLLAILLAACAGRWWDGPDTRALAGLCSLLALFSFCGMLLSSTDENCQRECCNPPTKRKDFVKRNADQHKIQPLITPKPRRKIPENWKVFNGGREEKIR